MYTAIFTTVVFPFLISSLISSNYSPTFEENKQELMQLPGNVR